MSTAEPGPTRVALARRAIGLIDLTDLSDTSSAAAVVALCDRAAAHGTAAVCVWPDFVSLASDRLAGTPVRVATVVNFPTGDERAHAVGVITGRARADGTDEVDVVLPYRALLRGDEGRVRDVLRAARDATGTGLLKVILETGALGTSGHVARAADLAIESGADFVKTSTGKTAVSATPEAVEVMLERIAASGRPVGLKPSGGISTLDQAAGYLDQADRSWGADAVGPDRFRFGASGLLGALLTEIDGPGGAAAGPTSDY